MPVKQEWKCKRLDGKVAVVTGGNAGIGLEVCRDLSSRGADVYLLCRNEKKAGEAISDIQQSFNSRQETSATEERLGKLHYVNLDLSSLKSVQKCAQHLTESAMNLKIDILVNNAGVMTMGPCTTEDGFNMEFGVNHLGHFLLVQLLLPIMKKRDENVPSAKSCLDEVDSRIIITSSLIHSQGLIRWDDINFTATITPSSPSSLKTTNNNACGIQIMRKNENQFRSVDAYAQSKLANLMHAIQLAKICKPYNIGVYCVNPGIVRTKLLKSFETNGFFKLIAPVFKVFVKSVEKGCENTVYCCVESNLKSGGYYTGQQKCKERVIKNNPYCSQEMIERLWKVSEDMIYNAIDIKHYIPTSYIY